MPDPDSILPFDRLPPGFAESLDGPVGQPAPPRPAATIVLLREGVGGLEVLLLKRVRSAGFVPGAYVFPGGRVDPDDADPALVERLDGLDPPAIAARLGLAREAVPAAEAYLIAALREAFEETGLLVGRRGDGSPVPPAAVDPDVATQRDRLLADEGVFPDVLDALGARLDGAAVEYVAHWVTPLVEPRRYDTRFFLAPLPAGCAASADAREMTDARWLRPEDALDMFHGGRLPMVFPTVRTLEQLSGFASVDMLLGEFRGRRVATVEPRLVRTRDGVGIVID